MGIISPPFATNAIGLADPRAAPYYAKLDGETDDYLAFKKLHEDVNSGTIKGYFVPGPAKITKELPAIKARVEIVAINNGALNFSNMEGASGPAQHNLLLVQGSVSGTQTELTANAECGDVILKVPLAFEDGTLLKLVDPETKWDNEQNAHPAEIVEVGRPDGALAGYNGKSNESAELKPGTVLTSIYMSSLNPLLTSGSSMIPAAGEIELENGQKLKYSSFTTENANTSKFEIEGAPETTGKSSQGSKVSVIYPAGEVPLRTAVRHESGYTTAAKSYVAAISPVEHCRIDNLRVVGPKGKVFCRGIHVEYGRDVIVNKPILIDCWRNGVRFTHSIVSHINDPFIENAREVDYGTSSMQGYGVEFFGATQDCSVSGGRSIRTRHSFSSGAAATAGEEGLPRDNKVINHLSISAFADGFDCHAPNYSIEFVNCIAVKPTGSGFGLRGTKHTVTRCKAIRPKNSGATINSRTIGASEQDIDIDAIEPLTNMGVTISSESDTFGKVVRFVRVRGTMVKCKQHGVEVKGRGEGAGIKWRQENVDIDVTISGGPQESPYCGVLCQTCENVRVRVHGTNAKAKRTWVEMKDVIGFEIDMGLVTWEAEDVANRGCKIKAEAAGTCKLGVVKEGPMINLGTGKSTEVTSASAEKVDIHTGPNEAVENKGTACRKVIPV